jgi:hypothetical protein
LRSPADEALPPSLDTPPLIRAAEGLEPSGSKRCPAHTTGALTSAWWALRADSTMNTPMGHADLPVSCAWSSEPSVSNHLTAPVVALTPNPSARRASRSSRVRVSSVPSRLTGRPGRIEFVNLRTTRSLPVALHLASRRRSYVQLQAGVGVPEEDSHLSDQTHLQAH